MSSHNSKSYSQILKSSSLVGGSQLIRLIFGILSTKFAAVFIGPTGVGLIGAYRSITQLGIQLSGLGINQSGVRNVAVAAGSGDQNEITRTVTILRRMCWMTGLVGAVGLAALAFPVSRLTFGHTDYALSIACLSLMILITIVAQGRMAVIQGLRRISDLVRVQIFSSMAGTLISIGLYATLGISGIVPALLAIAIFQLGVAWWYSRKVFLQSLPISWLETFSGAKSLVGLGFAFMISGVATTATTYAIRVLITRDFGIDNLGIYQAAFAISGYVLNFVLAAMGADFFPRLAELSHDPREMTRLVNEQTEVGLLLATPALVATLALAPLGIYLLYSAEFYPAVGLLRWFVMGCFLRVISWPMGFVQMAMGKKYWFILSQVFFNFLHIILVITGLYYWGLLGAAVAFFSMYVFHVLGIRLIAGYLINFTWSAAAKRLILTQLFIIFVAFVSALILPDLWSMVTGSLLSVIVGIYCLRQLLVRLGEEHRICRKFAKIPILKKIITIRSKDNDS
ncbi:O-antigen translocase [Desulfobacter hydrogenophilus]|uniref:O-antigen translocase n=1 Tax=Desulfobacter hydrogenophilus TaxID=2291 RepID=A0A328FD39_9BACT|nr:O-antigen translocase [Desulfobacter hydrogenophilus]NDY74097.1 O-antigen translocase [Desulfobacter hydrogenophilus]QBH14099.1 O-antigen translocase [Desulfobacter hydrogenophilus]RAM01660.1 O-antigen translocase [Desulfobacter hydrogenophilus]